MTRRHRSRALVLVTALGLLWPSFQAEAQSSDPEAQREVLRQRQADLASELDVLRASDQEIGDALTVLNQNVSDQIDRLGEAQTEAAAAKEAEARAETRVTEAEAEVDELAKRVRQMAVGLYVRPPLDDVVSAALNATPNDAPERFALARFRVEDVAEALRLSKEAKARLELARADAARARFEADERALAERLRLESLEAARAQQQAFAEQVTERIERALGEAGQLQVMDAELTAEIQRQQLELAARLSRTVSTAPPATASPATTPATTPGPAPTTAGGASDPSGGPGGEEPPSVTTTTDVGTTQPPPTEPPTTTPTTAPRAPTTTAPRRVIVITPVDTVWVGGIEVAAAIGPQLQAMLDAARQAGLNLTGSGYRNILDQIEIRREVCGPTDYDIYDKPSWECSPPVARPGFSMHEKGLAVDFTGNDGDLVRSRESPAFKWLSANAARFGFYNLPSEPWHWSTTGH